MKFLPIPGSLPALGLLSLTLLLTGCGKPVKQLAVIPDIDRAPEFVDFRQLEFRGTPRFDLIGRHSWRSGSVGVGKQPNSRPEQWRHVVPIVGSDWTKEKPVPLWVTFSSNREDVTADQHALQRALKSATVTGKNIDFPSRTVGVARGKSAWQSAVENATITHSITTDPLAPIVIWSP